MQLNGLERETVRTGIVENVDFCLYETLNVQILIPKNLEVP